jgi:hypothetical protein
VATLRSRDLHGRADWVDREFSALIDTAKNAALLRTLGIDVGAMTATSIDRDSCSDASAGAARDNKGGR